MASPRAEDLASRPCGFKSFLRLDLEQRAALVHVWRADRIVERQGGSLGPREEVRGAGQHKGLFESDLQRRWLLTKGEWPVLPESPQPCGGAGTWSLPGCCAQFWAGHRTMGLVCR